MLSLLNLLLPSARALARAETSEPETKTEKETPKLGSWEYVSYLLAEGGTFTEEESESLTERLKESLSE